MKNFTAFERNAICNRIAKDSIRKLELIPVTIQDFNRAFSMLGLKTSELNKVTETLTLVIEELTHLQNVASFGTTSCEEIDNNLSLVIEELHDN